MALVSRSAGKTGTFDAFSGSLVTTSAVTLICSFPPLLKRERERVTREREREREKKGDAREERESERERVRERERARET